MGVKVSPRNNENFQTLLRRFRKTCERENVLRDFKKHTEFEKPSQKRRRAKFRRKKNAQRHAQEKELNKNKTQSEDMFQW